MPSTVYKGDLAEVSFAPETGMVIRGETDVRMTLATSGNITTITFSNEANTQLFEATSNKLKYPKNILVGSQVVWEKATSALADGDLPNTGNGGRVFTIVENDGATIKITPGMVSSNGAVGLNDNLHILPYKTPPMDIAMTQATFGAQGTESVKTDQFLGIATALTLPETKVDLKRYHVVGLGRDVSVQVPGKLTNEGGSFEVAMHSARWLKYCLGHELLSKLQTSLASDVTTSLSNATVAGQSHVVLAAKTQVVAGVYLEIQDATEVPIVSDHEPETGSAEWDGTLTDFDFDLAQANEIRRVIGVSENDNTVYLDEPLSYAHAASSVVEIRIISDADTNPVAIGTDNTITDPVTHLLYSRTTQPSFALEVSQRRRDLDSNQGDTDGGVTDSKELTRVFRGCKVTDFTMTTDNDAALRLAVNFNAALCYTDTGRLSSTTFSDATCDYNNDPTITMDSTALLTPGMTVSGTGVSGTIISITNATTFELSASTTGGSVTNGTLTFTAQNGMTRYGSHRMFDDTANTEAKRLQSGIGKGTQKPFMFYNGSITLAGQQVAQVMNFSLTGQTGMQAFHTINGQYQASSAYADQVPFAGARNANLMVEGQTSYEMTMEIAVDDPLFYHKMRTGTEFSVHGENNSTTNQIRIIFEKNKIGSTADGDTEKMVLLIDDYYIIEAPLQIPEDKGVVKSTLKIMPKAIKVLARDTIAKY